MDFPPPCYASASPCGDLFRASIALRIGKLIGSGGEGSVYEHRDDPRMVIKVLHRQYATPERAAKLQAMRDNPPQNAQVLSWPNAVEHDADGLRYQMPKASKGAGTAYRFISANGRRQLPRHQQGYEYRAKLGVRIAEAFRGLHAIGVRVGDVNPSNILVSDDGSVMLIDCDSFQVPSRPGHQPYPCVVGSPEYTAPEIEDFRRQFRSQDSDNFALAVLLYQLLGNGSHPYQGIDTSAADSVSNIRERIKGHRFAHNPQGGRWRPTVGQKRGWEAMPEPVQSAFQQAFSPIAHNLGRPSTDTWASILEKNPNPVPPRSTTKTWPVEEKESAEHAPTPTLWRKRALFALMPSLVLGVLGYAYLSSSQELPIDATPTPTALVLPTPTALVVPEVPTPTLVPTPTATAPMATPVLRATPTPTPLKDAPTATPTPDWPPQPLTHDWLEWAKSWSRADVNTALQESTNDFAQAVDSLKNLPLSEACSRVEELEMRLAVADYLVDVHQMENAPVPGQHGGTTWKIWLLNRREVMVAAVQAHVPLAEC